MGKVYIRAVDQGAEAVSKHPGNNEVDVYVDCYDNTWSVVIEQGSASVSIPCDDSDQADKLMRSLVELFQNKNGPS